MEHRQTRELNNDFRTALHHLKSFGYPSSPRGQETKELLNYNFTLNNPRNRLITFTDRGTNIKYLLGEFFWYLSGDPSPDGIVPYSKFWDRLRNQDGEVNSNYGTRLFGVHDSMNVPDQYAVDTNGTISVDTDESDNSEPVRYVNQWQNTIELLTRDPDTRQAIQNIHMPFDRYDGNKDVPCTLTLHWFIRKNKLDLIVSMRSNDIILGFTNDVFQFTMLQEMMLVNLQAVYPELELGTYMHNANSLHIYEKHFTMMDEIIADERTIELSMAPMDTADSTTIDNLIAVEKIWTQNNQDKDFNFHSLTQFNDLSTYWQNLIKMCFSEDSSVIPAVFGVEHHDHDSEIDESSDTQENELEKE